MSWMFRRAEEIAKLLGIDQSNNRQFYFYSSQNFVISSLTDGWATVHFEMQLDKC